MKIDFKNLIKSFIILRNRVGFGIEIWKSRKNPEWNIPKIPKSPGSGLIFSTEILGFYGFLAIGIFSKFSKNPRDFWQIPGIRDFFESQDFYPRGSGFLLIPGFLSLGSGFFPWDGISRQKSQLWLPNKILKSILLRKSINFKEKKIQLTHWNHGLFAQM